jgi:hypothetical protein
MKTLRTDAAVHFAALGEVRATNGELWACAPEGPDSEVLAAALVAWCRQRGSLAMPVQLDKELWGVLVIPSRGTDVE